MEANNPRERDMERMIRAHFAAESQGLRAPANLWNQLEGRLEGQRRPYWQRLFRADGGLPLRSAPVNAVILTFLVFGSVWFVLGDPVDLIYDDPNERLTDGRVLQMREEISGGGPPLWSRIKDAVSDVVSRDSAAPSTQSLAAAPTTTVVTTQTRPAAQTTTSASTQTTQSQPRVVTALMAEAGSGTQPAAAAASAASQAPTAQVRADRGLAPPGPPSATTFRDYGRQPHVSTLEDAVSTFSLDTDRTSYYLALGWANSGYEVAPESVRAEEWINAFDYRYDPPPGDGEFAITSDLVGHPLDDGMYLARVAFQAPEVTDDRPINVTLVLDASGSMSSGNRVAIAREAAEAIRQSLRPQDRIAVVHFSTDVLGDLTVEHRGPEAAAVRDSIRRLTPHSSTNVQAGLNLGVRLADRVRIARPDAYNYIILMSDGVANVDVTDPFGILETAHDRDPRNPLRIIAIGVGVENYNDYLLEQLAQHGNGWYRYLNDTAQARATFARDSWLALSTPFADQTRAQVTWDPEVVKSWRIIGYENRVTPDETFTQDRKEFAELPSGAATTVFYELELHSWARTLAGTTGLGSVEVRWVEPSTGQSWSQRAQLSGTPRATFNTVGDPHLQLGAIVALASDRYSALFDGAGWSGNLRDDLAELNTYLQGLGGRLGASDAYQDFAFLLGHLAESAPGSSGYSR